jgi:hypothetical protein
LQKTLGLSDPVPVDEIEEIHDQVFVDQLGQDVWSQR